MKLIVISSPDVLENEASIVNNLFNEGLQLFHLRKPSFSKTEVGEWLAQINECHYSKIVLHQHHHLSEKFPVNRIHFTESSRRGTTKDVLNSWKIKGFTLSTSVHTLNDFKLLPDIFSYAFYGPVFESISKKGYKPESEKPVQLQKEEQKSTKIIALGGITPDKIEILKQAKFDGIALLGFIWNNPQNAISSFRACTKILQKYV